jgi:hypothetical protein
MSTTVTQPMTGHKTRAFYAHLDDQAGALTKVHGILYFIADDDTIVEVQPSMINFLCVLGEMECSDAQRLADLMDGGAAAIACTRDQGTR